MCRTMLHGRILLFTCSSNRCYCWHICTANRITVGNMYDKYVSYRVPKKPSRSSISGGDGLYRCWPRGGREGRKKKCCGACNIHVCIYAITSDMVSQPKNQALEENQWITDLAVNNVLDNLVGDDGDDWGVGQTGWWLVNPCLVRWGFRW